MFSLVIPVYRNEQSLPELLERLAALDRAMSGDLEAVFVVDGSPDGSHGILAKALPAEPYDSQLISLSRNFGSFPAIKAGLAHGRGPHFAVMAADLQEPPELMLELREVLSSGAFDIAVGVRTARRDSLRSRLAATAFWRIYKRLVQPEIPQGGVDVFACNLVVRNRLLALAEHNTTLVGLLFWLGFRRAEVPYVRQLRRHGRSGWTFARRLRYLLDSIFAFSDLPVRLLSVAGVLGMSLSAVAALVVLAWRLSGRIDVPGYTATILTVIFFGGLNSLGLGLIGEYVWRTFENTKARPEYVVAEHRSFDRGGSEDEPARGRQA